MNPPRRRSTSDAVLFLLDANVLIALTVAEHEHHDRASVWLARLPDDVAFAVCPVVEGALIRFVLRLGETAWTAAALLDGVRRHPRCRFVADDLSYVDLPWDGVRGHLEVTDAYLAHLAGAHGGRLATLDEALVGLWPDRAVVVC